MNALQQLLADAMTAAGMPLDRRGSKAELSRRSGVEDAIISNVFNRPRYVPDEDVRQRLATALGIPRQQLDSAAAEIKGLRVYRTDNGPNASRLLDELRADLVLSAAELTDDDLAEIRRKLDAIEADLERRAKPQQSDDA